MNDREVGQATVEFVLVFPLVVACMVVLVHLALVVRAALAVQEGAHNAVRVASLDADPDAARQAAARVLPGIEVEVTRGRVGEPVRVDARYRVRPLGSTLGGAVPEITVAARSEMRVER